MSDTNARLSRPHVTVLPADAGTELLTIAPGDGDIDVVSSQPVIGWRVVTWIDDDEECFSFTVPLVPGGVGNDLALTEAVRLPDGRIVNDDGVVWKSYWEWSAYTKKYAPRP